MSLRPSWVLSSVYLASLSFCLSSWAPAAQAQNIQVNPATEAIEAPTLQRYQRKYISFFYPQDYGLNEKLSQSFAEDFPRFDYHLASTALELSLTDFLAQVQAYQTLHAGEIAAGKTPEDQRFGDKVVSWSETQKIAQSAYVFVPRWQFDTITLEGPYPEDEDRPDGDWYMHAVSDVRLDMDLYNLKKTGLVPDHTISDTWEVEREKAVRLSGSLVRRAAESASTSSDPIDLSEKLSSDERSRVLKALYNNRSFASEAQKVVRQRPERYMMDAAVKQLSMGGVIQNIRSLNEFLIRAEIAEPNMQQDRIEISLGEGETAERLGIRTDASYKVIEYIPREGQLERHEVGFMKVRERQNDTLIAQPIIVGRDFELGDQVVEYPQRGFGLNLRGGGLYNLNPESFGGNIGLDLDINLGPIVDLSETYVTLSGAYLLVPNTFSGGLVELGIQKKWFFRQFIVAAALRGGGVFDDDLRGGGVTGLLGFHWQQNPDFGYGIDAGWRQYSNFAGPVLEAFIRFDG